MTNLSYKTKEKDIMHMLQDQFEVNTDQINKVVIITDKATSRSKGYGYIHLANQEDMTNILKKYGEMTKLVLDGRAILLRDSAKKFQEQNKKSTYTEKRKRDRKNDEKTQEKDLSKKTNVDFKKMLGF